MASLCCCYVIINICGFPSAAQSQKVILKTNLLRIILHQKSARHGDEVKGHYMMMLWWWKTVPTLSMLQQMMGLPTGVNCAITLAHGRHWYAYTCALIGPRLVWSSFQAYAFHIWLYEFPFFFLQNKNVLVFLSFGCFCIHSQSSGESEAFKGVMI